MNNRNGPPDAVKIREKEDNEIMEKKFYSLQEVADLLGLHINTVRNHIKAGRLHGRRIGRQWRFSEEDLQNYISQDDTGKKEKDNE